MADKQGTVLVVDDDDEIRRLVCRALGERHNVYAAHDALSAIQILDEGLRPNLMICDVMMPGMNGIELRERIQAVSPEQAARIVFVTGGALLPHVRALLERVPNTWLEKPIEVEALREFVRRRAGAGPATDAPGDKAWPVPAPGV
jgi:CheY-like chemotaxis protein